MARRAERGQASVELIATVPVVLVCALIAAQLALTGWALWTAGAAARVGARAAYVGGDARQAARSAIPSPLRGDAEVGRSGEIEVRVAAPTLVPGLPRIPVNASARLDPEGADD